MDFGRISKRTKRRGAPASHALSVPSTRSIIAWTPADYARAVRQADGGSIALLADFVGAMMRDGRIAGTLEQRTTGMLALPGRFEPANALPPDAFATWPATFPEAEQALCLSWGALLGAGFARVETDWCELRGFTRTIRTWHGRHFSHDVTDRCWYVDTDTGRHRVEPGQGWIIYTPHGDVEPWTRGLVHRLAVPYLAKTYAIDDRSRSGEVTPLLVAETTGLTEPQRRTFLADLAGLANDSRIVLPEGCKLDVVDRAGGAQASIHAETIAWSDTEIAIGIAGQKVTTEGAPGFSAGGAQKAILHSILRHQEETFSTCVGEQALTPWLRLLRGYAGETVYQRWDVSDPEILTAKAYAASTLGTAIGTIDAALAADGVRVDARALLESTGIPMIALAKGAERPSVALAPTDAVAVVSVNEARSALGLGALLLPDGTPDPAGQTSVAAFRAALEAGGAPGAAPAAPAAPGPVAGAPAAATDLAAVSAPAPEPMPDETRADFAARMTELAVTHCPHNRANDCARCGIERVRSVEIDPETGEHTFPVAWRAIPATVIAASTGGALPPGAKLRAFGAGAVDIAPTGEPPTEFLIFAMGVNATDKGDVIVDPAGIAATIEAVGNRELAIDLEHLSLDQKSPNYDPNARGWFKVRGDAAGIWATDVRWTEDGAARLRAKSQRYPSGTVYLDDGGRMVGLLNVALTAQPATRQIAPLIAASRTTRMDDATLLIMARLLLALPPDADNDAIAAALSEHLTGNKPAESAPEVPAEMPAGEAPLSTLAASATPASASGTVDDVALAAKVRAAFGAASNGDALAGVQGALASTRRAVALSTRVQTLEADHEARERAEILRVNARKFSPELLVWAQTQPPSALRTFSKHAPDLTSERLAPANKPGELNAADAAMCARFGTNPAEVAAIRARKES